MSATVHVQIRIRCNRAVTVEMFICVDDIKYLKHHGASMGFRVVREAPPAVQCPPISQTHTHAHVTLISITNNNNIKNNGCRRWGRSTDRKKQLRDDYFNGAPTMYTTQSSEQNWGLNQVYAMDGETAVNCFGVGTQSVLLQPLPYNQHLTPPPSLPIQL